MRRGKITGWGRMLTDQYAHSGFWLDGKEHGKGERSYVDGKVFRGKFIDGKYLPAK